MRQQRYGFTAPTAERPRLASPWLVGFLGSMIVLVLVVIYPRETLIELIRKARGGGVADAYLANLADADPRNPHLSLLLARKRFQDGEVEKVKATLGPALGAADPELQKQATRLLWQAMEYQFEQAPPDSPERRRLQELLGRQLPDMVDWSLPADDLAEVARKAFFLGNRPLAKGIFAYLIGQNPGRAEYWYGEAARECVAHGEYRAAADFYLEAAGHSATAGQERKNFHNALRTLQSGDKVPEALAVAERYLKKNPELRNDRETLLLLVTLARAAQRPDLADKYARALLRLALESQLQEALLAARGLDAGPRKVAATPEDTRKGPELPFDDGVYTLSFQAFLDNRKQDDAWKVAASAVRQAPDNLVWRKRLAEVSEWTGRPRVALENWLYIARATGRDDAWQGVLRLAPGLANDQALQPALQYQLSRQPGERKLITALQDLFERQGRPREARKLLEEQYAQRPQPWLLEQLAALCERQGDESAALGYWRRIAAQAGGDGVPPPRAIHVASLMLRQGAAADALALLEKAKAKVSVDDRTFWRLLAEVARRGQQDGEAIAAYRHIVAGSQAEESDYQALQWLLNDEYPLDSAQVAVAAWRRYGKRDYLLHALAVYAGRQRWNEVGQLLAGLDGKRLQQDGELLRYSALYHQHRGELDKASREMQAALAFAPQSADLQQAWLWLLVEKKDGAGLRRALALNEETWRANPALHDALAAAYLTLSLPDVALRRYLTPHLAEHREDFLWLMNYADALEQNQDRDRAWRLRQYLLADQRRKAIVPNRLSDLEPEDQAELRRVARARLLMAQGRGDRSLAVLRDLLRLDARTGKPERPLSRAAREVVAGWLVDNGQHRAGRAWLWQQYAKSASRPRWAELSVALADNDPDRLAQLLDSHGDTLPRNDRINAARRIQDLGRAQTDAFETMALQPNDDVLHGQLTDALLARRNDIGVNGAWRNLGAVREREGRLGTRLNLTPSLDLALNLGTIDRSKRSADDIGTAPDERYFGARLGWRHGAGETRVLAEARDSFASYQPLMVEHEQRLGDNLRLTLGAGRELPTSDSLALRLAGMEDRAAVGLAYQLSPRDRVAGEVSFDRYSAQTGERLGHGRHFRLDYSHVLRFGSGNLEVGAFWLDHRYQRRDVSSARLQPIIPPGGASADFFIPDSFKFYGVRLSSDTRFQQDYTRAWRPFASVALTRHSLAGTGFDLDIGIAGSVLGSDRLQVGWRLTKGGQTTDSMVRQFFIGYRLDF